MHPRPRRVLFVVRLRYLMDNYANPRVRGGSFAWKESEQVSIILNNYFFGIQESVDSVYLGPSTIVQRYLGTRTESQLYLGTRNLWP